MLDHHFNGIEKDIACFPNKNERTTNCYIYDSIICDAGLSGSVVIGLATAIALGEAGHLYSNPEALPSALLFNQRSTRNLSCTIRRTATTLCVISTEIAVALLPCSYN